MDPSALSYLFLMKTSFSDSVNIHPLISGSVDERPEESRDDLKRPRPDRVDVKSQQMLQEERRQTRSWNAASVDHHPSGRVLWARIKKKYSKIRHLIIHFPTSKAKGVSEVRERASERVSAAERASEASRAERANE